MQWQLWRQREPVTPALFIFTLSMKKSVHPRGQQAVPLWMLLALQVVWGLCAYVVVDRGSWVWLLPPIAGTAAISIWRHATGREWWQWPSR